MLHPILHRKLNEIVEARNAVRLRWANIVLLVIAAVFLLAVCVHGRLAHEHFFSVMLGLVGYLVIGGLVAKLWARSKFDVHQLSREIEERHPELQAVLLTAVEQKPGDAGFSYLQEQVIDEAVEHAARQMWADELTDRSRRRASLARSLALLMIACGYGWFVSQYFQGRSRKTTAAPVVATTKPEKQNEFELSVTPGDAEVEKGTRLIVEAKFAKDVPADATIIVTDAKGGESRRIPMRLTVDQQVFGGMISKIDRDSLYRVEFGAGKSSDYKITTYIHPELERADAKITPPAYTGLPAKEIKNTLKVTAIEGSDVAFQFKVNKPVASAELFGEDKTIIPLKARADDPTMLEASMKPETSQKYRLHLVDDKERSNKQPPWLTVNVQANQLPKIEVQFPKRDVQVSSIQELPVEAKVWDDLGVQKSGAVFTLMGKSKEVMLSTKPLEAAKKHDVKAQFDLENESAEPRQLVSYYFWAEDKGPKGEVRRAMSDMFFADVRNFEDIFREKEAPPSEPGSKGPKKGQADKLIELQKQVVNATWRLVRDTNAGKEMEKVVPDIGVVKQSEEMAMEQVKEAMEKAEDAEIKTSLTEAWKSMKDAVTPLEQAADEKKRGPLNQALIFEQSALEWLYRTASREHQVMRKDPKSKGSPGEQKNEAQLMNLELKQKEQRYEEEKQAAPEQTAEQQENLQVLNRLKELARRQEALAQKMKELEKQIEKAKTEEEKQELANQLKRLQEEQEQLLRDVDDLKEKMEKSENQATMAESKEQLEKTREQVLDAAEKLKQEKMAQAANSATRAQRELEQMQEDFRKKTSRKFSDEMKQMKQQAREAADEQKKIADTLENQKSNDKPGDTSNSLEKMLTGAETARQLDAQKERVTKLMEEMRRVSEQAETSEPLLSQSLYDAVRKAHTSGVEDNLEETRQAARIGDRATAQESERKATKAVEELQKGVDKAAESVLGSESDALRMARAELDSLIKGVKREGMTNDELKKQQANAGDEKKPGDEAKDGKGEKPGEQSEGKAGDESKDAKMADAQKGKASPDGKGKAEGEGKGGVGEKPGDQPGKSGQGKDAQTVEGRGGAGEKPGDQPGKGQQGKDAQTAQGKGGEKGEQPGPEGQSGKAGQQGQGGKDGQADPQMAEGKDGKGGKSGGQGKGGAEGQPQNGQASTGEGQAGQRDEKGQIGQMGPMRPIAANGQPRGNNGSRTNAGGGGGGDTGGLFFEASDQVEDTSPLTGSTFDQWSDRLRNVEELLNAPELRNEAARVLDNARALRVDYRRNNAPPQAGHVQARIIEPLVELRDRVAEELAKRASGNNLSPVDRDPVPQQYRELVRKYYQELGAGK